MRFLTGLLVLSLCSLITLTNFGLINPLLQYLSTITPYYDKIAHFLLFGTLTFCINWVNAERKVNLFQQPILAGSLGIFIFLTIEECSQMFIPSRNFEILDLLCNYAGILVFSSFRVGLEFGLKILDLMSLTHKFH